MAKSSNSPSSGWEVFTDKERLKKQQIIKKDSKEARNNDSKPTSVGEGQQDQALKIWPRISRIKNPEMWLFEHDSVLCLVSVGASYLSAWSAG